MRIAIQTSAIGRGGPAPWGCGWFQQWQRNVQLALNAGQTPIIVYQKGKAHTVDGLGFSQQGEVDWLERITMPNDMLRVDIDNFIMHVMPRARRLGIVNDLIV